jgi:hypothetical protein
MDPFELGLQSEHLGANIGQIALELRAPHFEVIVFADQCPNLDLVHFPPPAARLKTPRRIAGWPTGMTARTMQRPSKVQNMGSRSLDSQFR